MRNAEHANKIYECVSKMEVVEVAFASQLALSVSLIPYASGPVCSTGLITHKGHNLWPQLRMLLTMKTMINYATTSMF